jgi:RNA polymerase-binding transcription factor DksA
MNQKALEDCKLKLHALRERLTVEVQSGEQSIVDAAQMPGDDSHLPTHAADQDSGAVENNVATTQQQAQMLQAVDAALDRVSAGVYGICEECKGRIAPLSLEAIPYTPYCFDCASKLEGD